MTTSAENLKETKALHTFKVTIRNEEHFYKIVKWLNSNVGRGKENWTMEGRARKSLKKGQVITRKVFIYKPGFNESSSLYLNLI